MVTDLRAYAGTKSLHLDGGVLKRFDTGANQIGYEFAFWADQAVGAEGSFTATSIAVPVLAKYKTLTTVGFKGGVFAQDGQPLVSLGDWQPGHWDVVEVILDRTSNTYSVWIDGVLRAGSLHAAGPETGLIDSLELWGAPGTYIDNVRVFTVSPATTTTAATTPTTTTTTTSIGNPLIVNGLIITVAAAIIVVALVGGYFLGRRKVVARQGPADKKTVDEETKPW